MYLNFASAHRPVLVHFMLSCDIRIRLAIIKAFLMYLILDHDVIVLNVQFNI